MPTVVCNKHHALDIFVCFQCADPSCKCRCIQPSQIEAKSATYTHIQTRWYMLLARKRKAMLTGNPQENDICLWNPVSNGLSLCISLQILCYPMTARFLFVNPAWPWSIQEHLQIVNGTARSIRLWKAECKCKHPYSYPVLEILVQGHVDVLYKRKRKNNKRNKRGAILNISSDTKTLNLDDPFEFLSPLLYYHTNPSCSSSSSSIRGTRPSTISRLRSSSTVFKLEAVWSL